MTPGPGWRKCTAYRQAGPGGLPLDLRLSEGLDVAFPDAEKPADDKGGHRRCRSPDRKLEGGSWSGKLGKHGAECGHGDQAPDQNPGLRPGKKASYQGSGSERQGTDESLSAPEGRLASYEHDGALT